MICVGLSKIKKREQFMCDTCKISKAQSAIEVKKEDQSDQLDINDAAELKQDEVKQELNLGDGSKENAERMEDDTSNQINQE
jgi:hypothetical protein